MLAEAGVVDAGGAGFLLFLDALPQRARRPAHARSPRDDGSPASTAVAPWPRPSEHGVGDLRYEVMYFLEAPDDTIPAFKDVWAGIGDSIVVVGGDGIWNCHIHTDDIGAAIEAALDCGRPRNIRVTDLMEQVEEERWVREGEPSVEGRRTSHEPVPTAVVAVATGDGIRRIFYSLGVQAIVAGGQSMNPSTAQLLEAVEAVPADQVVILPNNKNIIPVAEQVDDLTAEVGAGRAHQGHHRGVRRADGVRPRGRRSTTTPTRWPRPPRPSCAGEVTRAVRDATSDAGPITEGDYIGLDRDGIRAVDAPLAGACIGLLDAPRHRRPRDRHDHRGRGRVARRHPPHHRVAGRAPPGRHAPRSTTAASRCTRTCFGIE